MGNDKYKAEFKVIRNKAILNYLFKYLGSIMQRGFLLLIPIFWAKVIHFVTIGDYDKAYLNIMISFAVTFGHYVSLMMNEVAFRLLFTKIYVQFSRLAAVSTFKNSTYSLSRFTLGEYINIQNTDIEALATFYTSFVDWTVRLSEFLVIFGYFWFLNKYIFFATFAIFVIVVVVLLLLGKKTEKLNKIRKEALDDKTVAVHETFDGIKEIKGFRLHWDMTERIIVKSRKYCDDSEKFNVTISVIRNSALVFIELARYLIMVFGVYLIYQGNLEVGTLLVIYSYYGKIIENADLVNSIVNEVKNLVVTKERFNKLLEYRIEQSSTEETYDIPNGEIIFENVLYGDREHPVLNNVSFKIKPNSITAITGKAGSGKSGIMDLLLKMNRKHSGKILIDGIEIDDIVGRPYFDIISNMRKDPAFFDMSIKENLMLVTDNFNHVKEVMIELGIDEEVMMLKKGYDTTIREAAFTSNTKYLLGFARVLAKDPKIMIFDEALNQLENDSQKRVLDIFKRIKKDHTIIIIARDNSAPVADHTIKLDKINKKI